MEYVFLKNQESGYLIFDLSSLLLPRQHFTEIIEDQFDFHTYCMRKMTLRSYVDLLRLEDVLRSHRFYERAARCAIRVYLRLHDHPVTDKDKLSELDTENMDPSELKKLRNKQKKARRKAEQEKQQQQREQAKKDLHNKKSKTDGADGGGGGGGGGGESGEAVAKDELVPEKLERPEDPLGEALKFLYPLQQLASSRVETHVLAFEIYWRRRRPLLMLQAVRRANKLAGVGGGSGAEDPRVHACCVRLLRFVEQNRDDFPASIRAVLDRKEVSEIFELRSAERNERFFKRHAGSLPHALSAARMMVLVDGEEAQQRAVDAVTRIQDFDQGVDLKVRGLSLCIHLPRLRYTIRVVQSTPLKWESDVGILLKYRFYIWGKNIWRSFFFSFSLGCGSRISGKIQLLQTISV